MVDQHKLRSGGSVPEALGLLYVEQTLGEEAVHLIIEKKTDLYDKDRYNEPNKEPPLLHADGAAYLEENKGAVALYKLIKTMGPDQFADELKGWMGAKNLPRTFESLYETVIIGLESKTQDQFRDLFEQ